MNGITVMAVGWCTNVPLPWGEAGGLTQLASIVVGHIHRVKVICWIFVTCTLVQKRLYYGLYAFSLSSWIMLLHCFEFYIVCQKGCIKASIGKPCGSHGSGALHHKRQGFLAKFEVCKWGLYIWDVLGRNVPKHPKHYLKDACDFLFLHCLE